MYISTCEDHQEVNVEIRGMILEGWILKVREMTDSLGISTKLVLAYLDMKKALLFTHDHVTASKEYLAMCNRNPNEVLHHFVIASESTKEQSTIKTVGGTRLDVNRKRPRWVCRPTRSWLQLFEVNRVQ